MLEKEDWRLAKIERLINEGVAANKAAERAGIGRKAFAEWWRGDSARAAQFRREFGEDLGRVGRRGKDPASVVDEVERAVSAGAEVVMAFRAAGVGGKRARKFLAERPDVRDRMQKAQADMENGLVAAIAACAGSDWRAAKFLLERTIPERWESAMVRRELSQNPTDPQTVANMLAESLALMEIAHTGKSTSAQALINERQERLREAGPMDDAEVEDSEEFGSVVRLAGLGQQLIDETDSSMRKADECEPLLRVDEDLIIGTDDDDDEGDALVADA